MEDDAGQDKLARLRQERPDNGWQAALRRALPQWNRAVPDFGWEKGLLAVAALLIAGVLLGSIVVLARSGGGGGGPARQPALAAGPAATATLRNPSSIATAPATRPATHLPAGTPTAHQAGGATPAVATPARSGSAPIVPTQPVRTPAPPPAVRPTDTPSPQPPPAPPPEPPPPPPTFGASDAIALAVDWITHSAPEAYATDASACNAIDTGGHWVVTCNATVVGCSGSACQSVLSVCVFADTLSVRPSDQC